MFFPSRCYNGGPKHNFEARHSTREYIPDALFQHNRGEVSVSGLYAIKTYESEYIRDVCTWCGNTIEAEDKSGGQ